MDLSDANDIEDIMTARSSLIEERKKILEKTKKKHRSYLRLRACLKKYREMEKAVKDLDLYI